MINFLSHIAQAQRLKLLPTGFNYANLMLIQPWYSPEINNALSALVYVYTRRSRYYTSYGLNSVLQINMLKQMRCIATIFEHVFFYICFFEQVMKRFT